MKKLLLSALCTLFLLPILANAQATTTATSTNATTTVATTTVVTATSTASFTSTPTCTIVNGANSCVSPLSWTSANTTSVKLTDCAGGIYETTGSGAQSDAVTIPYNGGCYQIRDASTSTLIILATINGTSSCAGGTSWNGSICVTIPAPINGTCGTASGTIVSVLPTTGLCSAGTSSTISGTSSLSWNCTGLNGGTTAICGATFVAATTTPVATTTPPITSTSTTAINLAYTTCVQTATLKRDTALVVARNAYTQAMTAALNTRSTQDSAAILLTDATARVNALKAAANAYKVSVSAAQQALKTAQANTQKNYTAEITTCKTVKNQAIVTASTTRYENERKEKERKRKENEDRKHAFQDLRNEYKNKWNALKSHWGTNRGNH